MAKQIKRYALKNFFHYEPSPIGEIRTEYFRGDEIMLDDGSPTLEHYESSGMVAAQPPSDPAAGDVAADLVIVRLSESDAKNLTEANERVAAAEAQVEEMKKTLKAERTANTKSVNELQKQLDDALAGKPAAEQSDAGDDSAESD